VIPSQIMVNSRRVQNPEYAATRYRRLREDGSRQTYQQAYYQTHKDEKKGKQRAWRRANPHKVNALQRRYHRELLAEVIAGYGGKCICCEEAEPTFLTLDHISGNGNEDRRQRGNNPTNYYRTLVREGFPPHLRLLCFNCNVGRERNGGVCPHRKEVRTS